MEQAIMVNHTPEPTIKQCSKCKECFPATADYFNRTKQTKDGLFAWCKPCKWASDRKYRSRPEVKKRNRRRKQTKEYRTQNRARERERRKRSEVREAEKRHKATPEYRARAREQKKELRKTPRYKMLHNLRGSHYRARKRKLPTEFKSDDWNRALEYFHGCCAVCGRQLNDLFGEHTAAMDHWIPLSSPDCPGTVPENIVPLCHGVGGCNNKKGGSNPHAWIKATFGISKGSKILQHIEDYFAWIQLQQS